MKLQSFRIQNFKSILDTGWCSLSIDNITGLIGQNESGKSSILEAIASFYSGRIDDDALRHDEKMPEISISLKLSETEFYKIFGGSELPVGLSDAIKKNNWRVNLTKRWVSATEFNFQLEEEQLNKIFENSPNDNSELIEKSQPSTSILEIHVLKTTSHFVEYLWKFVPTVEIFVDNKSLLPNTIDLDDVISNNSAVEGYQGVMNFLTIAKVDLGSLKDKSSGIIRKYIKDHNNIITADFQEFWTQKIGKNNKIKVSFELKNYKEENEKKGKFYLEFWIDDGFAELHPKQRSQGVRWFLSFYLQLKASKIRSGDSTTILLIDEPGESLHARAQEDVLSVFENIKEKIQIIYTTHSPYLIKLDWLYRLLAVQRADEKDDSSETLVFDAHKLGSASSDTLTPILTNMGLNMYHQNVIGKNNIILEEPSAFFYLIAFIKIFTPKFDCKFHYIPATGADKVPQLVNLFLGWGLDFCVLLDNDAKGQKILNKLTEDLFSGDKVKASEKIFLLPNSCLGIEDIFSNSDFKKFVLEKESTYNSPNSEYMKNARLSKPITAAKFKVKVENNEITLEMLEEETRNKISTLLSMLKDSLHDNSIMPSENLHLEQVNDQV